MQRRAFSRPQVVFLVGVPLAWAVLLLFHPNDEGGIYQGLQDKVTPWLVVHIGMMLFIPLMAVVVYLLLRGVGGAAAWVSRIALVPFVVFYSAWEALFGIGNGILVKEVNGLPFRSLVKRTLKQRGTKKPRPSRREMGALQPGTAARAASA